ncbi:g-protein coupled receptor Mth2 [Trichonephila clavata]|uniref:G-protein coupled receptor Mth2 n=1 Tax=Trichonephila clavata TaxID=2740835 RepID=A0A8X6KL37_TRICU|nr:g-protein coupled receptor Mth2 [Trichonephila clavata]
MREQPMMSILHFTIFLLLCFTQIWSADSLVFNYTEVQKLGNSCPQLDTCENQESGNKDRNCACDELCVRYGDCCIDAPGVVAQTSPAQYNCFELEQFNLPDGIGIYMKDTCLPSYEGPDEVRRLCENTSLGEPSDPLGSMPITDPVTGITFKNYYCSICNDKIDNLVLWTPRLECPTLTLFKSVRNFSKEFVFENLVYQNGSWGLYLDGESESPFFHDCSIDPVMPTLLESKIRLCKLRLVSDCPPDWEDDDTRTMCRSYMGARFIFDEGKFRNIHCAYCNQQNLTSLSCQPREMKGIIFRKITHDSFSLLLDINEGKGEEVGLIQLCENGEVYDPFFRKCRSLMCLPGYMKRDDYCVLRDTSGESVEVSGSGKTSIVVLPETEDVDSKESGNGVSYTSGNLNSHFQNVTSVSYNLSALNGNNLKEEISILQNCLLISLADEDYVMLPNKSIYVPKYDKVYEPTSYYAADGSVLVCSHFTSNSETKFLPEMGYITIVGLGTSMICLFLHFIAFWMVPDLQNLSGKSLVSQCVSLFCAYACFIIGLHDNLNEAACSFIAFCTFYFFQVAFFWMGVIAFDVWRTLKMATTELRVSGGKQIRRFIVYSFFTWVTPLFLVCILALAELTDLFPLQYRPAFAEPRCWFKRRRALLVFFALPLFLIMFFNVVLFACSSRMILMTTQTSAKQQNQAQRRNFKLYLRLALLMGLTWIIGVIAAYADVQVLWYIFILFNTLQGLFIFIAFTCSTKVRKYLKDKLYKAPKGPEFRSTTHSGSTGSCFHTNSTHLHSNIAKKFTSKLLLKQKDSTSTNSTSSTSCQTNSPM